MVIGEAFPASAFQCHYGAFTVSDIAGVIAKIKFMTVAAKVGFAHVVIGSDHAALEYGKEVFSRVAMLEASHCDIFFFAVIDDTVAIIFAANFGINRCFICH